MHACLAVFQARPDDVRRAWVTEEALESVGDLLRELARQRKPYKVVDADELGRVAGVRHHEGVCIQAVEPEPPTLAGVLAGLSGPARLVFLDGVSNPHNLGAILRVCAHFGAAAVVGARGAIPAPTGAARRVAEGAAEHVPVVAVPDALGALREMSGAGLIPVATAADAPLDLFDAELPERCVFLLGAERTGLSDPLRAAASSLVSIGGTGAVESLNVSTACAVLLAEHWRRRRGPA